MMPIPEPDSRRSAGRSFRALVVAIVAAWMVLFSAEAASAHPTSGIVVDSAGNVYFITLRPQIFRVDPAGNLAEFYIEYDGKQIPVGIYHRLALGPGDHLYFLGAPRGICKLPVAGGTPGPLGVVARGNVALVTAGAPGPIRTSTYAATPLAVDSRGRVYLTQSESSSADRRAARQQIIRVDPDGTARIVAGGEYGQRDGQGAEARFRSFQDAGMAVGPDDTLYVTDAGTCIRRITPGGNVTTLAGTAERGMADGPGPTARFSRIVGIDVDASGTAYVADSENRRIRRVTPDGVVATVAGNGRIDHADGPALEASFFRPTGVAAGLDGELYVLDTSAVPGRRPPHWTRVRRVSADGHVTTLVELR